MGKKIIIESSMLKLPPFSRYRMGYLDGYVGVDKRLPRDSEYTAGFEEGACDDRMGVDSKFDTEGHS
jgi:hypothetical protein